MAKNGDFSHLFINFWPKVPLWLGTSGISGQKCLKWLNLAIFRHFLRNTSLWAIKRTILIIKFTTETGVPADMWLAISVSIHDVAWWTTFVHGTTHRSDHNYQSTGPRVQDPPTDGHLMDPPTGI